MNNLKKHWKIWGLLAVLIISIMSCKDKPEPTGCLFGKIFYQGTTVPVPGVVVDVNGLTDTSSLIGVYMIREIPPGDYDVQATKSGFDSGQVNVVIADASLEQNINLTSEAFTSSVFGNIRGNISGNPQTGVNIIMLNPDGEESLLLAVSDSIGYYELKNVPQGERTIVFKNGSTEIIRSNIIIQNWSYSLDVLVPELDVPVKFVDERDGNSYYSMVKGKQIWMIENLRYLPAVHQVRQESVSNPRYYVYLYDDINTSEAKTSVYFNKYGVAYNFPAALTACPQGWHLPSDEDWNQLQIYLGMSRYESTMEGFQTSGNVGYKLKSETGWPDGGNGDNSSHMNLKPYGGKMDNGSFYLPERSVLWTSTEFSQELGWTRVVFPDKEAIYRFYNPKITGNYVRCVKN